jgi:hypothetical protein
MPINMPPIERFNYTPAVTHYYRRIPSDDFELIYSISSLVLRAFRLSMRYFALAGEFVYFELMTRASRTRRRRFFIL